MEKRWIHILIVVAINCEFILNDQNLSKVI
jgi:hypothetical protein